MGYASGTSTRRAGMVSGVLCEHGGERSGWESRRPRVYVGTGSIPGSA